MRWAGYATIILSQIAGWRAAWYATSIQEIIITYAT
jgi:hypothetical protein